jgi:hypothetical protein
MKNFFAAFFLAKNLAKIKDVVNVSYVAIVKTLQSLAFIETQLGDTKLGLLLENYIPKIIEVLTKVKELIEKYGKYIGVTPVTPVAGTLSEVSLQQSLAELDGALKKLNEALTKND